jgi:AcrR family transcriptional regulator
MRAPLNAERIVAAAIELADEDGVAALSMRNLAKRLGYEVMSLYNHVANKDELLTLMVDAVTAEIDEPSPDAAPLEAVRAVAVSTHEVLVRHRWAADLWQRHMPGPSRTGLMETLLRLLDHSGLSPTVAHHGFHAVTNHVVGYTLQELGMALAGGDSQAKAQEYIDGISAETYPYMVAHVHQHLAGDSAPSFELVLDLILDGLVRLDENR